MPQTKTQAKGLLYKVSVEPEPVQARRTEAERDQWVARRRGRRPYPGFQCSGRPGGSAGRAASQTQAKGLLYKVSEPKNRPGGLSHRGSALLSVLWLSAALSLIAFTVATNVRGEIERTSTEVDSLRTYYLATAGIERALLYIQWGGKYFTPPTPILRFTFPSGETTVEIIPENSKFDINRAVPQDLTNLIQAVGANPDRAAAMTAAIVDWRTPSPGGSFTDFDKYYLSLRPSFHARHASIEEIEELLLVRGMTPDLFHGRFEPDAQDRLVPVPGLKDCLSVYGGVGNFDVNTASPALMRGLGVGAASIAGILAIRAKQPIKSMADLESLNDGSPGFGRLGLGVSPVCTLRSTAHLRLPNGQFSDVRRSVSALVGFLKPENNPPFAIMRWYDNAWSAQ